MRQSKYQMVKMQLEGVRDEEWGRFPAFDFFIESRKVVDDPVTSHFLGSWRPQIINLLYLKLRIIHTIQISLYRLHHFSYRTSRERRI